VEDKLKKEVIVESIVRIVEINSFLKGLSLSDDHVRIFLFPSNLLIKFKKWLTAPKRTK